MVVFNHFQEECLRENEYNHEKLFYSDPSFTKPMIVFYFFDFRFGFDRFLVSTFAARKTQINYE
jgi:hypothetical protein